MKYFIFVQKKIILKTANGQYILYGHENVLDYPTEKNEIVD